MTISHVAILENPIAGKGNSASIAQWLEKELANRKIASTLFKNEWPEHFENFSDVWMIGGDGTINYFINQYPNCTTPIALFKGGTGNDFAWKLYGDRTKEEQLEQVLSSTPKWIDAGKFNDILFINCLGVGFDGEILRSMKTIRLFGGHIGYLMQVIQKIFFFHEYKFKISTGNESWNEEFLLVMVVNSSRAGGGFFISPNASVEDKQLDMVLCKKLPILKRLRYLPIIERGKHLHLPFVIHRLGSSFTIESEKEMDVQVDGELRSAKNLEVEVLAGKFLFRC